MKRMRYKMWAIVPGNDCMGYNAAIKARKGLNKGFKEDNYYYQIPISNVLLQFIAAKLLQFIG